ncbi:MAG: TonB-dependent receptor [Bacteroidota bacterium]
MCCKPADSAYHNLINTVLGQVCLLLVLAVLLLPQSTRAQGKFSISGTIKDAQTGESLIGATITTAEVKQNGVVSNDFGFYSLSLPAGNYTLQISYIGYKTILLKIVLDKNLVVNQALTVDNELQEVVVKGNVPTNDNISNPQMGLNKLDANQLNNVPVLLGEKDILKTIQLLPGVKSTGDANTGYYVRGGGADQNLILLDGAQVYNATHLFGFFSIFNSDAIKDVSLYKGGMPAMYGGRLSSVLDVKMDEGNNQKFGFEGGIGLISSRIKAEGPLVKGKSSFMVSARRTYADAFLRLSGDSSLKGSSLYFYDLNTKLNYQLDDKNTLYLSAYYGKDDIGLKDNFSTNWGNTTASLRWNHIYSSKLFANTSVVYSNYNYAINNYSDNNIFNVVSRIKDFSVKSDFTWFATSRHQLTYGADITHHHITPGNIQSTPTAVYNSTKIEDRNAYVISGYLSDDMKIGSKINLVYGARLNLFSLRGPGTFYTYDKSGLIASTTNYGSGAAVQNYLNLEPRVNASYTITDQTSVKASYNHNSQNIHLLSNSTAALPTDIYVMSSNNVKPGIADQVSLGYYKNLNHNVFELSAEVYYKWLQNQIDYKNNAQLLANENVESQLLYGSGRAYGLELFLKKKYGRLNGWIGYTLSRVENKFADINNGAYFPARQDRTHDISLVGIYQLKPRVTISAVFVYGTGNAVTFPDGKYKVGGVTTYYYSARNGYRLPSDNRLDLGIIFDGKPHKKYRSGWTFGIYNVYNRKNPYSVIFRDTKDSPPRSQAVETSLFGIIPSVTWNFKF